MSLPRLIGSVALLLMMLVSMAGVLPAGAAEPLALPSCLGRVATIIGTARDDTITGTPADDVIVARGGDDAIQAGDGDDRVCGGPGADRVDGRYGRDLLSAGPGVDRVFGGPGSDLLIGGRGRDRLIGGDQRSDSDTLIGGPSADVLRGGDGDRDRDYLFGGGANDFLDGGAGGRDRLYGGSGNDYIYGGVGGTDAVSFEFARAGIAVDLVVQDPMDDHAVGEGSDYIDEVESVSGSRHADRIEGDHAANFLHGLGGADTITSAGGDDYVDGGRGADTLDGGEGGDTVAFESAPRGVTASLLDNTATGAGADVLSGFRNLSGSFYDDHLTGDDQPNFIWGSYGTNALFGRAGDDFLEFGDSGDAGAGDDECIWSSVANCEMSGHFDPPSLPYISNQLQGRDVDGVRRLFGGIAGGIARPDDPTTVMVSVRRMTGNGCWWWNKDAARFQRGACGVPLENPVPVQADSWSVRLNAPLTRGSYEAGVSWRSFAGTCSGAFAPMCIAFDVS